MIRYLLLTTCVLVSSCSQSDKCTNSDLDIRLESSKNPLRHGDTLHVSILLACKEKAGIALLENPISSVKVSIWGDTIASGQVRNKGEYSLHSSPVKVGLTAIVRNDSYGPRLYFNTGDRLSAKKGRNTLHVYYRQPSQSLGFGDSDESHPLAEMDFIIEE